MSTKKNKKRKISWPLWKPENYKQKKKVCVLGKYQRPKTKYL